MSSSCEPHGASPFLIGLDDSSAKNPKFSDQKLQKLTVNLRLFKPKIRKIHAIKEKGERGLVRS